MKFFVQGVPVPKGSAKAFYNKHLGRAQVVQDNADKQKPWASAIHYTAQQAGCRPIQGAVRVELAFHMPRLKGHFRANGEVKANAPVHHTKKPDSDKLTRCVFDALTGVAWMDDSQVANYSARKFYSDTPGVEIEVVELADKW